MADVDEPESSKEDPYAYTGETPARPPEPAASSQPWAMAPPPAVPEEPRRRLWRPAMAGFVATLALLASMIFLGFQGSGTLAWIGSISGTVLTVGIVACLIMLIPTKTRRWAGGMLLGASVGLGVAGVVFAGVCVVAIASYSAGP